MEVFFLHHEIKVFGKQVKTFPDGISDAFGELVKITGDKSGERNYYGISEFKNGTMVYYVAAAEETPGEAKKYGCEELTIEKGNYLAKTLFSWKENVSCIKDVFYELLQDEQTLKTKPAIEWYKNDEEMMCLVKMINK